MFDAIKDFGEYRLMQFNFETASLFYLVPNDFEFDKFENECEMFSYVSNRGIKVRLALEF